MVLPAASPHDVDNLLSRYRSGRAQQALFDVRGGTVSGYDEFVDPAGNIRPAWQELAECVGERGRGGLNQLRSTVRSLVDNDGITYVQVDRNGDAVTNGNGASEPGRWHLDALPLVISSPDWDILEAGVLQRSRLLDAVLTDLYGPRVSVTSGVLPPQLLFAHPGYIRAARGIEVPGRHQLFMHGCDVSRGRDGGFVVNADWTQAPSGAGYALADRRVVAHAIPDLYERIGPRPASPWAQALRLALIDAAPESAEEPVVVLLSPGIHSEIQYLPEPPATVEAGPNIAASSADDIWLPGCWVWHQNRYAWRPGYWTQGHQDWDWVPDHYVWTPSGYIFVDGYYDYSVPRRGIVFAPVYFNAGVYTQRGFSYSPSTVINPGVFVSHLFLRPGYGHYYFGDYYGSNYRSAGFSPWFSYHSSRRGYDPIYANQRWQHRQDRDWEQRTKTNYRNYRDNEDARPPRTWAAQRELAGRGETANRRSIEVAAPLDELARKKDIPFQLQPVDQQEQQRFGQRGQEYRKYLQQRQQLEANAARTPAVEPANPSGPARRPLARSPFVAQPAQQLDKNNAPPQRHEVLKPDFQVQPQPRTRGGQPGTRQGYRQGPAGVQQEQQQRNSRIPGRGETSVHRASRSVRP